jgi:IPT/TIG domain
MRPRRLTVIGSCLIALCAMTSAGAQAGAPRWYGQKTGSLVPFGGNAGLVEPPSPESLQSMGQLKVIVSTRVSVCFVKDRGSIEDPSDPLLPGTGKMEEFEVLCEEGTGPGPNEAAPFPCVTNGEAFELKGINLNWPSTLEVGASQTTKTAGVNARKATSRKGRRAISRRGRKATNVRNLPRYYDKFTSVALEIYCLKSKQHAIYKGSLRPEVPVGRLTFRGSESGELEEPSSGYRLNLKGTDWITPERYKDIRVNSEYHERPVITSLTPNNGLKTGGTQVAVHGSGFAVGTSATVFKFGAKTATSVNCTSTTSCTVVSPAHEAGTVDVKASANGLSSAKNAPADQFTYN